MRLLFVLALLGGCYSPSIAPCHLACAGMACPDGLACNSQGLCAESETAMCSIGDSDGGDGNDSGGCGWPSISNVDPCALDANEAMVAIEIATAGAPAQINTDSLVILNVNNLVLKVVTQEGVPTGQVAIAIVKSWTHRNGTALNITGARPLIILANEFVMINGPVNWAPSFEDTMLCPTRGDPGGPVATIAGGGGGGGGGYGTNATGSAGRAGGSGGNHPGPPPTLGGIAGGGGTATSGVVTERIRPLRGGCPGGPGGAAGLTPNAGGAGGRGGGALQISARTSIRIASAINVPGGGGAPGSLSTAGARSGGGGGGAGGGILLEAPEIDLMNGLLCANGGGGGGTGGTLASATGQTGTCTNTTATGGSGTTDSDGLGGSGATGGTSATVGVSGAAGTGMPTPTPGHGGGGGGGSVGRIRINGTIVNGPSTATPQFTMGTL